MSTKLRRLSVSLPADLAPVLADLARLTRQSQAGIVAELLSVSTPMLSRTVALLRAIERRKAEASALLRQDLEAGEARLLATLGVEMEALDRLICRVAVAPAPADGQAELAPAGAAGAGPTPMSNRGVTPHPPRGKKGQ